MRAAALTLLFALVAAACGDATGSSTEPAVLTPGREVSGKVGPGDTAWYEHRAGVSEAFSVVLKAVGGSVTAIVRDPAGREVVPQITATYTPPLVGQGTTEEIVPAGPTSYRVVVVGDGNFRIQIAPTASAPEHAPAEVGVGATINESMDGPGDTDDFFLHGKPGDIIIAYVQAVNAADTRELHLSVSGPEFSGAEPAVSTSRDTELETQATGRFVLDNTEPLRFRLTGPYVGAYRFKVRKIDPSPETVPPAAVENTPMVAERLDYVGDIDEFVLRGPAGAQYNVMLRLANGDPQSTARVEVSGPDIDTDATNVTSSGRDSLLADRATGRFTLPVTGTAKVRVQAIGLARGLYELLAFRIDSAAEGPKRSLTPSDSVTASIDVPGDVDEYTLDLPTRDTLNLAVTRDVNPRWASAAILALEARILTMSGRVVAQTSGNGEMIEVSGSTPLAAGHYKVQVNTLNDKIDGYRGPYRLALYRLRSAPETGNPILTFGAAVSDAIDPIGDVDTYEITAAKGDHIDIRFQLLDPSGGLGIAFSRARDDEVLARTYSGLLPVPDFEQEGSRRITIEETGRYRVAVGGSRASEQGRYRMMVRRYPAGPEHHPQRLVPGDVVTDEATDELGDVDEFSLEGSAGAEATASLTVDEYPQNLVLELVDPVTRSVLLQAGQTDNNLQTLGRFQLPPSGRLTLRIAQPRSPAGEPFSQLGSYRLTTHSISRAPEQHAATIAIGDTVSDESIDPIGDIDEFRFSGVAGQQLVGLFDTPLGLSPPGLVLEVIVPGSGGVLASVSNFSGTPRFGDARTPIFTLPATGTYMVRVQGLERYARFGGPYRFAIVPI